MRLGQLILNWRIMERWSLRDAAKEIGVSYTTLSRVERGEAMDGVTLAAILKWIVSAKDGK
jgi:transcriptional regulator with XRE-family HTH domain